jgi:hypothetical protein
MVICPCSLPEPFTGRLSVVVIELLHHCDQSVTSEGENMVMLSFRSRRSARAASENVDGLGPYVRAAYHAMGTELQLGELMAQRESAETYGRLDEVQRIAEEMKALQDDLACTADRIAFTQPVPYPGPVVHGLI